MARNEAERCPNCGLDGGAYARFCSSKPNPKPKPTIAELEAMLDEDNPDNADLNIEIQPDGSIRAVHGEPNHATPEVHTFEEVLGDDSDGQGRRLNAYVFFLSSRVYGMPSG